MEEDGDPVFMSTKKLNRGWTLNAALLPEGYTLEDAALKLSLDGGETPLLVTEYGEGRTEEELRSCGLVVLDGHYGVMQETRTTYGSGSGTDLEAPSFGLFFEFYLCGQDWNTDTLLEELSGQFTFFAGDGTPLEQYFDGFDSIALEAGPVSLYALLYRSDGAPYDEAQYQAMCEELKACSPYMIFTGADGTEQRFDLFTE